MKSVPTYCSIVTCRSLFYVTWPINDGKLNGYDLWVKRPARSIVLIYIKKKKERTQILQILAVKFFCLGILFITHASTFAYGNIKYASRQTNSASFATAKAPLVFFSSLFFISCFLFFLMPARLNADAYTSQSVSLLLKIWRCTENPCNHFHLEMHDLHVRDDKYYQSTTMRRSYVHYSHARKTGFIDSIGPASEIFAIFYYAEICCRLCRIASSYVSMSIRI